MVFATLGEFFEDPIFKLCDFLKYTFRILGCEMGSASIIIVIIRERKYPKTDEGSFLVGCLLGFAFSRSI